MEVISWLNGIQLDDDCDVDHGCNCWEDGDRDKVDSTPPQGAESARLSARPLRDIARIDVRIASIAPSLRFEDCEAGCYRKGCCDAGHKKCRGADKYRLGCVCGVNKDLLNGW